MMKNSVFLCGGELRVVMSCDVVCSVSRVGV